MREVSIRKQLFGVLLYCWIVPMIAIFLICALYIQTVVKERAGSSVKSSAAYAAQMTMQKLDSAVSDMRAVIQDGMLGDLYIRYNRIRDEDSFAFAVRNELSSKFNLKPEYLFAGVSFEGDDSRLISVSQYGAQNVERYLEKARGIVRGSLDENDNRAHVIIVDSNIYLFQNLLDNRTLERYGIIVLQLSHNSLLEYFYVLDPKPQYMMIQINDQAIWPYGLPDSKEALQSEPILFPLAAEVTTSSGYISATAFGRQDNYGFGYRLYVSDRLISEQSYIAVLMALALCVIVLPLLGYGLLTVYRRIVEPIDALVIATERIENEQWDTQIVSTQNNEYGRLINSFNSMSSKIRYLFDYAYREELAASESRLRMLQSQINPHFLNNTLELINWKARLADNEEISLMIEALGNLLDASLDRKGTKEVTLREELSYMQSYLFIIKKRFGERLSINEHTDNRLLECRVPRLIIQPLIENAVVHGVEPAGSGRIDVFIGRMDSQLGIEIINDGQELSKEQEERISSMLSKSDGELSEQERRVGIRNVQERLHIMYGGGGRLTIQRMSDGKTLSRIVLPIVYFESEDKAKKEEVEA